MPCAQLVVDASQKAKKNAADLRILTSTDPVRTYNTGADGTYGLLAFAHSFPFTLVEMPHRLNAMVPEYCD